MNVLNGINYWMKKLLNVSVTYVSCCRVVKTNNLNIACFSLLISIFSSSCSSLKSYGKHEKRWAYSHPFAAIKLKKVIRKCDVIYNAEKDANSLDKYENGGKLDAFRHIFYMAMFSAKVSCNKVRKLGIAHEKDNYLAFLKSINEDGEKPDSFSCEMDLLNNEFGIGLSKFIKRKTSLDQVKTICIKQIMDGNAYFMKRDSIGNYLKCNGEKIDLNLYKQVWNVPKCLVRK